MESQNSLLNSRADIEFVPIATEDESPEGSDEGIDETEYDPERNRSLTPLQDRDVDTFKKNEFKNRLSFFLSVFNLMNVIVGSGFLGLAEAVKNLGIVPFVILLFGTACLASLNINFLLHTSDVAGRKTYEGLAQMLFGIRGKVFTSVLIILHCIGVIVTYIFIVKHELPEVIKALVDYHPVPGEPLPYYLTQEFIITIILLVAIIPLSSLKDIRFLGYSSAIALLCIFFLLITVVVKKFSIPCPLPLLIDGNGTALILESHLEVEANQTCEANFFAANVRTAYAFPTMLLAFMCHASMLPIYSELRVPTIKKMQRVANASIFNVFFLYVCAALFGYLTFYNSVQSELLLSYSLYNSKDGMIIVARMMLIICLTFSAPLLHYPARKTIIITFFKNPNTFSWFRHIGIMLLNYAITVVLVFFVPNVRDVFGIAGATFSGSLFLLFPPAFFIKMVRDSPKADIRQKYRKRQKFAWVILIMGAIFLLVSTILVLVDWVS